jgi:Fe-S-cluster containining protein
MEIAASQPDIFFNRNRIRINSSHDCVFLDDRKCIIHNEKPLLCRAYPYYKIHKQKFQCRMNLTFSPHNIYQNPKFVKYLLLVAHDTLSYIHGRKHNISATDLDAILIYLNGLKNKFIPIENIDYNQTKGASLTEIFYFLNILWLYFL